MNTEYCPVVAMCFWLKTRCDIRAYFPRDDKKARRISERNARPQERRYRDRDGENVGSTVRDLLMTSSQRRLGACNLFTSFDPSEQCGWAVRCGAHEKDIVHAMRWIDNCPNFIAYLGEGLRG